MFPLSALGGMAGSVPGAFGGGAGGAAGIMAPRQSPEDQRLLQDPAFREQYGKWVMAQGPGAADWATPTGYQQQVGAAGTAPQSGASWGPDPQQQQEAQQLQPGTVGASGGWQPWLANQAGSSGWAPAQAGQPGRGGWGWGSAFGLGGGPWGAMGGGLSPLAPWLGSMMGRGMIPWTRQF